MEFHDEICFEKLCNFEHNSQAFLEMKLYYGPDATTVYCLKASFQTDFEGICNYFKNNEDEDLIKIIEEIRTLKNEYTDLVDNNLTWSTNNGYYWCSGGNHKCCKLQQDLPKPLNKFIKIVSSELMKRKKTSEKKLEELEGNLKETEKRNNLLQRDVEDLQAKKETSEKKIEELEANLQETEKRIILLQRDVEDLQAKKETSGKKIEELEANLQETEKRSILLQRDVEDLQAKNDILQNDLRESETKNVNLQNDLRESETKLQGKEEIIKEKFEQQNQLVAFLKVDIEDRKSKEKDLLKLIAEKEEILKLEYVWTADLKKEKDAVEGKMAELLKEYSVLKASLEDYKSDEEYLRKRTDELAKDNESLKAKIKNLNKQRESEPSSKIEKANSKANIIVRDCNNLYENKYSIAKEEFAKNRWNEKFVEEWLLEIFMECFKETKDLAEISKSKVKDLFKNHLLQYPFSNDEKEFPHHIEINISQMLQEKPDPSILENLSQKIFVRYPDILKQKNISKSFKDFIDEAVHVTWQVNTCNPPMYLSTAGEIFDDNKHIRIGGHGNHIKRFLWPCVYMSEQECKKGEVLQRGYVVKGSVHEPEEPIEPIEPIEPEEPIEPIEPEAKQFNIE